MRPEPNRDLIGLQVFLTQRSGRRGWEVFALEGDDRGRVVAHVRQAELMGARLLAPKWRRLSPHCRTRRPGVAGMLAAFDDQVDVPRDGERVTYRSGNGFRIRHGSVAVTGAAAAVASDDQLWVAGALDASTIPSTRKVTMNSKTRFNPAFAGPHQQTLLLSADRGGYWSGVKDDHWPDDIRYWLDPLTARYAMMPDACFATLPMAMGREVLQQWCITDLALMDPETVFPSKRNGVLHRFAAQHVQNLLELAAERKMSPHQLPMSIEEAYDMDLELDFVAWPWLRDKRMLDEIEKSARTWVHRAAPVVIEGRGIESDFLDANTRCFLETGWHAVENYDTRVAPRPDLQEDAAAAAEPFFEFPWDDLRDCLVLPMWSQWEEKEQPYFVHSSNGGFFTDQPGWKAQETERLHDAMQAQLFSERLGHDVWREPTDPKIIEAMERLLGFVRAAEERQNQDLVHA